MGWLGRLFGGGGKQKAEAAPVPQGFPFETVIVPGVEAQEQRARMAAEAEGRFVPIILGGREDAAEMMDGFEETEQGPDEVLAAARSWTPEAVLKTLAEAVYEDEEDERPEPAEVGDWPADDEVDAAEPLSHLDIASMEPHDEVVIARVPCSASWQAPVYLRFGDWNDCPAPEHHAVLLRDWNARYGAEVIAIGLDSLECSVRSRPSTRDEALALAREHYAYCPDLVDQGFETLAALAADLMVSETWRFWWD